MSNVRIKGTSLSDLVAYIKDVFPEKYQTWLEELPPQSKDIFYNVILNTSFYDVYFGHVEPLKVLGKVCFENDIFKAAYECGRYGSQRSLKGIYSIFLKIPSVDFVVKRVSMITATYLQGVTIDVSRNDKDLLLLEIKGYSKEEFIMIVNMSGWIDNLMSIVSKKPYRVYYEEVNLPNNVYFNRISIRFN